LTDYYAYVDDDPVDATDPSGLCWVAVHFDYLSGVQFRGIGRSYGNAYHTFITTQSNTPSDRMPPYAFEAIPSDKGFPGIGQGVLYSEIHGPIAPADQSNVLGVQGVYVRQDNKPCSCYIASFTRSALAINALQYHYVPTGPNSNSFTYTLLHHVGITSLDRHPFPGFGDLNLLGKYWTPGWYMDLLPSSLWDQLLGS